jgi:hypothetical protein
MTAQSIAVSPRRDHSVAFPLILITAGVAIFLANAGYLTGLRWSDLVALWPILLVLGGVHLLLRPRSFVLAAVVELAIIVATFAYALTGVAVNPVSTSYELSVPRAGISDAIVTVNYGGGMLRLTGGGSELVTVRSTRDDVTRTVDQTGATATVVVSSNADRVFTGFGRDRRWEISLPSDVRAGITLNLGAGDFDIDLSSVRVVRATINAGASDLTLRMPQPRGDVPITLSTGASSVDIDVPDGVEYRIESTGALASISGSQQSAGYATAADRLTIHLASAMSSVTIH